VIEIWYTTDSTRREEHWVANMIKMPKTTIAYPGFGASDSKDMSHLFMSVDKPEFARFCALMAQIPNHAPIHLEQRMKSIHEQ
jgi:Uri superfamily endonuclease